MKHKGEKLFIEEDNVFTACLRCGKEHTIDLCDILKCKDADLYGADVYCEECSITHLQVLPVSFL